MRGKIVPKTVIYIAQVLVYTLTKLSVVEYSRLLLPISYQK